MWGTCTYSCELCEALCDICKRDSGAAQVAVQRGDAAEEAGGAAPMEGVEGAAGASAPAMTLDLGLPEPADVDARYMAELGPLQVGDWDSAAPGAYNR